VLRAFLDERRKAWLRESVFDAIPWPKLALASPKAGRADVTVGATGADVRTLAEAVRRVGRGGTIVLRPGVHEVAGELEVDKPFSLAGAGAATTLVRVRGKEAGLTLSGKNAWSFSGVGFLYEPARGPRVSCNLVQCQGAGARLSARACVFAGARGWVDAAGDTTGGVGALAYDGASVELVDCHLAFNLWNAAAFGGGATLEMSRCTSVGGDIGLFVGAKGRATARASRFVAGKHALKSFRGPLRAERCSLTHQEWTSAYCLARMELVDCTIAHAGAHGVACDPPGDVTVTGSTIERCGASGVWVDAKAALTGNTISHNEEFGVLTTARARVTLSKNETDENEREGVYRLGTLARDVAAKLPIRAELPKALVALAGYQEETGRLGNEAMYVSPGPLAGWDRGKAKQFAVFGSGPDGSVIAYWLRGGAKDLARAPVVYLDSEGVENFVLADSVEEVIALLAYGHDELRWVQLPRNREAYEHWKDEIEDFAAWAKRELGISPRRGSAARLAELEKKHPGLDDVSRPSASSPSCGKSYDATSRSRLDADELLLVRVVAEDVARLDREDPAGEVQPPRGEALGHERKRAQVLELHEHVLLGRRRDLGGAGQPGVALLDDVAYSRRLPEPPPDVRQLVDARRVEHRLHRAAVGVPADDDVLDLEHAHRVLDRRGRAAGQPGRHDVADVAHDEELARRCVGEEVRHHARVRAGDEQRLGPLPFVREPLEELAVAREVVLLELVNAVDELLHPPTG
jgi:hypothetical protein